MQRKTARKQFVMQSREWEYNIQNDLWEVECECVMAIEMVLGCCRKAGFVNVVIFRWSPYIYSKKKGRKKERKKEGKKERKKEKLVRFKNI